MGELNEIEMRREIEMESYFKANCILTLYGCLCTSILAFKLLTSPCTDDPNIHSGKVR
jgi:hypothetical protein